MSWRLIKSIQEKTDLRLILPFGLNIKLGTIVGVNNDGRLTLEGDTKSILNVPAGPSTSDGVASLYQQGGTGTSLTFRGSGTASTLFPDLPSATAGFDIELASSQSWILASTARRITALEQQNQFRRPILDAYKRGVWRSHWALVTSIATVSNMTFLASTSADTRVALSVDADVNAAAGAEVKLTSNASIAATNRELIQCIYPESMVAFYSAIRVKDPWFGPPNVGTLEARGPVIDGPSPADIETATDDEFWEDADNLHR